MSVRQCHQCFQEVRTHILGFRVFVNIADKWLKVLFLISKKDTFSFLQTEQKERTNVPSVTVAQCADYPWTSQLEEPDVTTSLCHT